MWHFGLESAYQASGYISCMLFWSMAFVMDVVASCVHCTYLKAQQEVSQYKKNKCLSGRKQLNKEWCNDNCGMVFRGNCGTAISIDNVCRAHGSGDWALAHPCHMHLSHSCIVCTSFSPVSDWVFV